MRLPVLSLRARIVALVALAAVLPAATVGFLNFERLSRSLTETAVQSLTVETGLAARAIQQFLEGRVSEARIVSQADVLEGDNAGAIRRYLQEVAVEAPWIGTIGVTGLAGGVIAESRAADPERSSLPTRYPGADALLRQAVAAGQGDVFVSEALERPDRASLLFVTPVTDEANVEVIKVLFVDTRLDFVNELLGQYGGSVGISNEMRIADRRGRILTHLGAAQTLGPQRASLPSQPPLGALMDGDSQAGSAVLTTPSGAQSLTAFTRIPGVGLNRGPGWAVIAAAPLEAVTAASAMTPRTQAILALSLVLALVGFALWLAHRLTDPLQRMVSAAARVKTGDYDVRLTAPAADELGSLAAAINDMAAALTQRKQRIQHELAERGRVETELRESRSLFRAVIDNAPLAITVKARDGRYLLINERFSQWFGFSEAETCGKTVHDLFAAPVAAAAAAHDRAVLDGAGASEREFDLPFLDGTTRRLLAIKFPILGPDRQLVGIGVIEADVTEHRHAEAQLRHAQKMEAVGQLTGGIAHDFNNLLAVVIGNLDLAIERTPPADPRHDLLEGALDAAARGSTLTQRLLAFSRKQVLAPVSLELNETVRGMRDLLRRALGAGVDIQFVTAPALWRCEADPSQLETALLNLALNAHDAMPDGGKLTIETANVRLDESYAATRSEVVAGDYVMLAITDTGKGIDPEVLPHVFEPFFTTKDVGKGSGLGLSMVFGFVKQSRGHISIYSEPGQGTTVKLYLPRTGAPVAESVSPGEAAPPPRGHGEQVLVVEDDPQVRALAARLLREFGYRVREAGTGPQALAILGEGPQVDLLLTDAVLPGGMSGRQLADAASGRYPRLKVLYMSGYTENAIVHHGRLDPGVPLLQKPFRAEVFARRVRDVLDHDRE